MFLSRAPTTTQKDRDRILVAVDDTEDDHVEKLLALKARCKQLVERNKELSQQLADSQLRSAEKTTFIEQQKKTMSRLQLPPYSLFLFR